MTKTFIAGKIQNYRSVLKRFERDYGDDEEIETAISEMDYAKRNILQCTEKGAIRGLEGNAAALYFSVFPKLIINPKEDFPFSGRNRRPPKDAVNAMSQSLLSILYLKL